MKERKKRLLLQRVRDMDKNSLLSGSLNCEKYVFQIFSNGAIMSLFNLYIIFI